MFFHLCSNGTQYYTLNTDRHFLYWERTTRRTSLVQGNLGFQSDERFSKSVRNTASCISGVLAYLCWVGVGLRYFAYQENLGFQKDKKFSTSVRHTASCISGVLAHTKMVCLVGVERLPTEPRGKQMIHRRTWDSWAAKGSLKPSEMLQVALRVS